MHVRKYTWLISYLEEFGVPYTKTVKGLELQNGHTVSEDLAIDGIPSDGGFVKVVKSKNWVTIGNFHTTICLERF